MKIHAIFHPYWVRKLIGKLGVPYNRRFRVRGSPHPNDYDADLSLAAAESNAFRNQFKFFFFAVLSLQIVAFCEDFRSAAVPAAALSFANGRRTTTRCVLLHFRPLRLGQPRSGLVAAKSRDKSLR
jgi:hypothetical protein